VTGKRIRRRTPVRLKQIKNVANELSHWTKSSINLDGFLEQAHFQGVDMILIDRVPMVMKIEIMGEWSWYPTIRGIKKWGVERFWVAVDDGAIPFLKNGADCMGAGIHIADPDILKGDFVWIRDQETGDPIATGVALTDGEEMMMMKKGKAIQTIHWIGDDLWGVEI